MANCHECIEVKDLSLVLGGQIILDKISFTLNCGEYVGLIGPNGGGKTSLLKTLLGIYIPTEGSINVNTSKIGYVPQKLMNGVRNFPATVSEIVATGSLNSKTTKDQLKKVLQLTKVAHLESKIISNLSGGELQRVFIARALIKNPSLLILDEPNTGIDSEGQEELINLLSDLNKQQGITILVVSHDIDVISHQASKFLCLNKKLVCHDSSDHLHSAENIEHLYGKNAKIIPHHHHH